MTEIVEAQVVEEKSLAPANLFGSKTGTDMVQAASERASALAGVVDKQKLFTNISGKKHVRVEGWTLLGSMLGVFPVTDWVHELHDDSSRLIGFEARVEARTLEGNVVGAAVARCTKFENRWSKADDYAISSMAQTRATSKALRQPLGFVMQLAGYEATPAEEMDGVPGTPPAPPEQREGVTAASASPAQPATPSPAPPSDERPELLKVWWGVVKEMGFSSEQMKSYVAAKYPLYEDGTKDMTADEIEAEIAVFNALDELGALVIKDQLVAGTFMVSGLPTEPPNPVANEEDVKRYRRRLLAIAKECGHDAAAVKKELGIKSTNDLTTHDAWLGAIRLYEAKTQPPTPEK